MNSSAATPTRFPQKYPSSNQSLADLMSRCYLSSTDTHSSPTSPPRLFSQGVYVSQCSPLNQKAVKHSRASSPPPTDSDPEDHNPIPSDSLNHGLGHSRLEIRHFGGILDSPLVVSHSFAKLEAPLSPPMTIPTPTSSLPLFEYDREGYLSSPFSDTHDLPDQECYSSSASPLLDPLTPSSRSSCSTLQSEALLSPLSPNSTEWPSHFCSVAYPTDEARSPNQRGDDTPPFPCPDGHFHDQVDKTHPMPSGYPVALWRTQTPEWHESHPTFSNAFCESPKSIDQDLEPIDFDDNSFPPFPFSFPNPDSERRCPYLEQTCEVDREQQYQPEPEEQKHEQATAPATFPHTFSPSLRSSSLPELDDLDVDVDFPDFSENIEPPPSPSRRSWSELPQGDNEPPPSLPSSYLGGERDTLNDTVMLSPPESPGLTLLSFPGADTDEDLIPSDLASPKASSYPPPPLNSRLITEDDDSTPHSSSSRRSPSPEPCTLLDVDLVKSHFSKDDELRTVCGLLKRTKDRERAARQMESLREGEEEFTRSISGGSNSHTSVDAYNKLMDARRKARRMVGKVREVATLLRLKLAERGLEMGKDASGKPILTPLPPTSPHPGNDNDAMRVDPQPSLSTQSVPKGKQIKNPHQLLATMVLDRHEPKYNPNSRAGLPSNRISSPLARASISVVDDKPSDIVKNEEKRTIPDNVAILDIDMDDVDGKEDLLEALDLGMETPAFS